MDRILYEHSWTMLNRRFETMFMPRIKRALNAKVKTVRNIVASHGVAAGKQHLHSDMTNPSLVASVKTLYTTVGLRHARDNQRRLKTETQKGLGFSELWTRFILQYLQRFLTTKITFEIQRTTRDYLLGVLNESTVEGWSLDETLNALDTQTFTRMQAARIVRTEVNRAANVGVMAQADSFEFQLQKTWIATHDKRTRGQHPGDHANHIALDGITIDLEDDFTDPINGDKLEQPGDPNASAASTINCRCSIGTSAKRDARGNLIPKRQSTTVIYPSQIPRRQTFTI